MKKLFLILLFLVPYLLFAQGVSRNFYSSLEFRHYRGVYDKLSFDGVNINKHFGNSLRIMGGYRFSPHFTIGVGCGLDSYLGTNLNTFPIFYDIRAYLKPTNNSPFAYYTAGFAPKLTSSFTQGILNEFGAGYRFTLYSNLKMRAFAGYKNFFVPSYIESLGKKYSLSRHSIVFGVGVDL